jgi:hypothetical protein
MRVLTSFLFVFLISVSWASHSTLRANESDSGESGSNKSKISIQLRPPSDKESIAAFLVTGLSEKELTELTRAKLDREQWTALFLIQVHNPQRKEPSQLPPVLGSYRVENKSLIFEPRFPLAAGVQYQATFAPSRLPNSSWPKTERVLATFTIPKANSKPTTKVEHVYPSADVLPENQLKFYIHFSAPMSKGEAYQRVHLIEMSKDETVSLPDPGKGKGKGTGRGKEVALPFLRLDEELWDQKQTRFTLLFDPGRIKRGLKPREEVGPALEEGKSYTFVIDSNWIDAEGNPLKESFRKSFRVGPPEDNPIEPKSWKIRPPSGGSRDPLVVVFPKPLDHAMLERVVTVTDESGHPLEGTIAVTKKETHWSFTPKQPWQAGRYHLTADSALEDMAGNSIGRPFEVDVFHPIQRQVKSETVKIPFEISSGN